MTVIIYERVALGSRLKSYVGWQVSMRTLGMHCSRAAVAFIMAGCAHFSYSLATKRYSGYRFLQRTMCAPDSLTHSSGSSFVRFPYIGGGEDER